MVYFLNLFSVLIYLMLVFIVLVDVGYKYIYLVLGYEI